MIQFILLLLKFNVAIMAIWLFYTILLKSLTFFVQARFFLLCGIFVSVFISLIRFEWAGSLLSSQTNATDLSQYIRPLPGFANNQPQLMSIFLSVYGIVALILMGNLLIQYLSFRHLKKQAQLKEMNGRKIYITQKDILPFSFGNAVFVSEKTVNHPGIEKILAHEFIHIRQKHSIDIFIAELVRIVGWFNPFAWLLKKTINQNLEFLTDAELLGSGVDRKAYQYLLLHFSGNRTFSLVTNFNFYSLKTRISKMNQNKSNRLQYSRFLLFIPMMLVMMFVFSCMNDQMTDEAPTPKKMGKDEVMELKSDLNDRVAKLRLNLLSKTVPDKNHNLLLKKVALNDAVYELELDEKSTPVQTLSLKEATALNLLPPPPPPTPTKE